MSIDLQAARPLLQAALDEDIGPGDPTTDLLVPEGARGRARIVAGKEGVLSGLEVALEVLRLACGGGLEVQAQAAEGTAVKRDDCLCEVEGPARGLLRGERTALNFLMRMSGIATLTARFVHAVAGTGARILDTRKTAPGLRLFDKAAVRAGGGHNHRFALYDAVLVKENHLAFGGDFAGRAGSLEMIVEAESLDEFRRAMEAGADVVMLDEVEPADVAAARALRAEAKRPLIEVSGGIHLDNVRDYAEAGAERISVGALTHSAPALDLSMRIEPSPST